MAVCQRMATYDSGEKPQTALPHDVAKDGRRWSAGFANLTDFLEQLRISRKRLGLDDLVPYQTRHSGVSIDLNNKFRSLQEAHKRRRWRQHPWRTTKSTRDYKPLPVGTPRASLHFSELHATTSWTPSGIAPRSMSALRLDEGPTRGPAVLSWEWNGTCMSAGGFLQPVLGSWTGAWRARSTPVAACDGCFKRWHLETFCVSSSLLRYFAQHNSHKFIG